MHFSSRADAPLPPSYQDGGDCRRLLHRNAAHAAVWLLCAGASLAATEGAPPAGATPVSEATVYYSKEDPHWPEAEKTIAAVAQQYAPLKIVEVSIDDAAGYAQLEEAEKRLHIASPGDITLVIGQVALTSRGQHREVETYFGSVVKRLRNPQEGKGRLAPDAAEFAGGVFGTGVSVEPAPDHQAEHYRYYAVLRAGKRIGWVVDAFRHVNCPTCNDMQFLMAVSVPDLKVLLIRPERDLERLAVKLSDQESGAFVTQFVGRTPATSQVRADAVTAVTKTCRMYENAVRDALLDIQKREQQ